MNFDKQELINALCLVKPGLAKKAIVDQATHFLMMENKIVTYNDRICISYPFNIGFSGSVSADEFYKILDKIPDKTIDIDKVNDRLKIKGSKIKADLSCESGEIISSYVESLKLDDKYKFKNLSEDFLEALRLCSNSCSNNMGNAALTAIFINDNLVASTDDLRISEFSLKKSLDCSFLLPCSSAIELIKFNPVNFYLSEDKNWIYFQNKDKAIFCSRLIPLDFPDYKVFLEGFDSCSFLTLPDDMYQLVDTAAILADDMNNDQEIEIKISKGKIRCKGQNKLGWIQNESSIDCKDSFSFVINAAFFLMILNHTNLLYFEEGKALFKTDNYRHIIALRGE